MLEKKQKALVRALFWPAEEKPFVEVVKHYVWEGLSDLDSRLVNQISWPITELSNTAFPRCNATH